MTLRNGSARIRRQNPSSRYFTNTSESRDDMRLAWRTLSVVSFASIIAGMANSALNVALPTIVRDLDASASAANWTLLGFMLTETVLLVVFGRIADMIGRRAMYLTGVAAFGLASVLCGFAPTAWFLVAFRLLQATGVAMLLSNSGAIVTSVFPRHRLGEGMGIYLASFSIAQLIGPTLGGVLTEYAGWRWIFWFNAPACALCLIWGIWALRPESNVEGNRSFDVKGTTLLLVALSCGLGAFSHASSAGWLNLTVLIGLLIFLALIPIFLWIEHNTLDPVIDLAVFKSGGVLLGMVAALFNACGQIGIVVLMTLYFQVVENIDSFHAGLRILPLAIFALLGSSSSGMIQRRFSASVVAISGNLIMLGGLVLLFSCVVNRLDYALFAIGLSCCGIGTGFFMPSNTTAIMRQIPDKRLGIINAMRLMLQNSGMVMGTAVILGALTSALPPQAKAAALSGDISGLRDVTSETLSTGYERAIITMIVIIGFTVVFSMLARRARFKSSEPVG